MQEIDISSLLDTPRHHAHLILGDTQKNFETLRSAMLKKIAEGNMNVADMWLRVYENVGIDDAREIRHAQTNLPVGDMRIVLVSLRAIQHEAQNSLLKLFEDPQSNTVFFVCTTHTEIFLPTVLSRFSIVHVGNREVDEYQKMVSKFLSGTIKERFELIEAIVKEKDKTAAEGFLNRLEVALRGKISDARVFEDIFAGRQYLRSRAPSVKMILENLCGIVPVIS